jgi:phosphotransferase system  glucose/maltose/N-acetylglucosamine-specific IIC component
MLIPVIIPILFRISVYFFFIAGIFQILQFLELSYWKQILFIGVIWFIIYPIAFRIICEVLIILSDMNDTLTEIKKQLNSQQEPDD